MSSDVENDEISDIDGAVQDLDVGSDADGESDGPAEAEPEGEDLFGDQMVECVHALLLGHLAVLQCLPVRRRLSPTRQS